MRLLVTLLAVGVCMTLPSAASAQFSSALFRITVQGSGTVNVVGGLTSCNRLDNLNDRVRVACSPIQAHGAAQPMEVIATPNPSPARHWRAVSCNGVAGSRCSFPPNGDHSVLVVFADDTAPTVTTGAPAFSTTQDRAVSFPGLTANEPASFECRGSPAEAFRTCSAATQIVLSEGPNDVQFRATDRSGNTSPIVTTPVQVLDTRLVSGPPAFTASRSATVVASTLTGFSFDCALDGAPLADCGAKAPDGTLSRSFSGLADGTHTYTVRARNGTAFDRVALTHSWTVDTVAPTTALDPLTGPGDGVITTLTAATFGITANEPASFQCRLDGAAFAACPATRALSGLALGAHRFEARAIDRAGNVDATPAARSWTVQAVDADGDGFSAASDCNDGDPLVKPGAREIAGNTVDENCDAFVAPPPRMSSTTVQNAWSVTGRRAKVTRLRVKRLRSGARVEVRCLGRRCAFKRVKARGRARRGTLDVLPSLRRGRRVLRAGQTLEVRITAARVIGKVVRFRVTPRRIPQARELCLPPGTGNPRRC